MWCKRPVTKMFMLTILALLAGCAIPREPQLAEMQRASQLIDQAVVLLRKGELERAQAAFELSSELMPSAAALDGLGCIAFLRYENQQAERLFKRALEFDLEYTDAIGNLAMLYEQMGKRELASRYYRRAIRLDLGNYRVRNNYAVFLSSLGGENQQIVQEQLLKADILSEAALVKKNIAVLRK